MFAVQLVLIVHSLVLVAAAVWDLFWVFSMIISHWAVALSLGCSQCQGQLPVLTLPSPQQVSLLTPCHNLCAEYHPMHQLSL